MQGGREHNHTFHTQAIVKSIVCSEGKGYSKKESQQLASKYKLASLKRQEGLLQRVLEEKAKRLTMEEDSTALLPNLSDVSTEYAYRISPPSTGQGGDHSPKVISRHVGDPVRRNVS